MMLARHPEGMSKLFLLNGRGMDLYSKKHSDSMLTNVRETKTLLFCRELKTDQGTAIPLKITQLLSNVCVLFWTQIKYASHKFSSLPLHLCGICWIQDLFMLMLGLQLPNLWLSWLDDDRKVKPFFWTKPTSFYYPTSKTCSSSALVGML